jgi:hypothetical protein
MMAQTTLGDKSQISAWTFRARRIEWLHEVEMIPSAFDTTSAVIFVHGYGGDVLRKWSEFNLRLQLYERGRLSGSDLLWVRWSSE